MAMMPGPSRPSTLPKTVAPSPPPPIPPGPDPDLLRLWSEPSGEARATSPPSSVAGALDLILEEFTRRWELGERPRAEQYLDRLPAADPDAPIELIYHEFCLHSSSGLRPEIEAFVERFPAHRERLFRLIALHDALPSIPADEFPSVSPPLPEPGDDIGPYRLIRELGRGGFARVFLASDAELEDRLLVVKVTDRPSAEHRYLARAPHPHIVSILRERTTDDGLQLIFMPFVGGATLRDVLDEARCRPNLAPDLLDNLDRCSAPEFTAAGPVRPARELLSSLSYPQAIAWIIARLAEALDHAYQRGVTHGDLKPSNILIGGDAQPMLLDFNLSTDQHPASRSRTSSDPGGTLAYMAPERLRAIAEPELATFPTPEFRHKADLYALGLILREALTGIPPEVLPVSQSPRSGRALAAILAHRREAGDPASRKLGPSIPAGLRAILRRCLAPDPIDRYPVASQLALDLDRWRLGLSLRHATPPRWVEASRWVRYRRRPFLAASLCLSLGLIATGAASRFDSERSTLVRLADEKDEELANVARSRYEGFVSDPESGAYVFREYQADQEDMTGSRVRNAERILTAYGMLNGSGAPGWGGAQLDRLAEPDRSDARAWLIEQALRFGIEATGPDFDPFPEDRRLALELLDQVLEVERPRTIEATAYRLRSLLGQSNLKGKAGESAPCPAWLDAYLEGVLAETLSPAEAELLGFDRSEINLSRVIERYRAALADRPDLYWPRYRLASSLAHLGNFDASRIAFETCLNRRPENPLVLLGLGSCKTYLNQPDQAIDCYRSALRIAPRWIDAWRDLAVLGAQVGRDDLIENAVARVQHRDDDPAVIGASSDLTRDLSALLGRGLTSLIMPPKPSGAIVARPLGRADDPMSGLSIRAWIADELFARGDLSGAVDHFSQVLAQEPDHLTSRYNRAVALQGLGKKAAALDDYAAFAADPNVDLFIEQQPAGLFSFILLAGDAARRGSPGEAIRFAERAVASSERTGLFRGDARYALARARASLLETDPSQLGSVVAALESAKSIHPEFIELRFHSDPAFDRHRAEVAVLLGGVEF